MRKYLLIGLFFFMAMPVFGNNLIGAWKSNVQVTVSRLDASEEVKSRIEARLRELGELKLEFTADRLVATRNGVATTMSYSINNTKGGCYDMSVQQEGESAVLDVTYCVEDGLLYIIFDGFREYYSRQ